MNEIEPTPTRAYFKDTPETREKVLAFLRLGATRTDSAHAAGISKETFYHWLRDVDFSDAVREAEGLIAAEMAACIAQEARKVKGDWRAAEAWLKRRRRKEWGDNIKIDVSQLTNDQILDILAEGETEGGGDAARADRPEPDPFDP
jgi:Rieske Fe-S protein